MISEIRLELADLRAVAAYAARSAEEVLGIFEQVHVSDSRPREAIRAARIFACGGPRVRLLRDAAWAAQRAAQKAGDPAASEAARAAMSASAAAFLHPIARSTQVRHILGAAAHAARATELAAGDDPAVGHDFVERVACETPTRLVEILRRYPGPPQRGGRTDALLRMLDQRLRGNLREGGAG